MNYEIIRIVLSKRSEQEKSKKILLFVIDQVIFPNGLIGLIGEYWSYAESVSRFLPSLICPDSNEIYRKPYVCANDSKDLVVYEQKVFDKYNVPCIHVAGLTTAFDFLRDSECELKIVPEQKSDSAQGIHSDKHNEFMESLDNEPLNQINFFSELRFQIAEAKKLKLSIIDLAAVIQKYPYPLIAKKRHVFTHESLSMKLLSIHASFYSTIFMSGCIINNNCLSLKILLMPVIYGNMVNREQMYETSIKYIIGSRSLTFNRENLKRLVINPFLVTIAIMNDYIWEMHYAKIMADSVPFSISATVLQQMCWIYGLISLIPDISKTLTCLDIYCSDNREQSEYQQTILNSKTAKALLCISFLNSAWLVYDFLSMESHNDYLQNVTKLFSIINFGISIPRLLLSSRQTATELKEVCERPRQIIESAHDEEGFRESFCTTLTRRVSRLSSGVLFGVFRYLYHNDPIRGVIAGIAAFNESSILNVIRWSPRMYRRFPTELYQPEQKSALETKVDEPEDLSKLNANAR